MPKKRRVRCGQCNDEWSTHDYHGFKCCSDCLYEHLLDEKKMCIEYYIEHAVEEL